MNQKELRELIEFLIEKDIAEFELERGDIKVRIKRGGEHGMAAPVVSIAGHAPTTSPLPTASATLPTSVASPSAAAGAAPAEEETLHIVHSPIVGTYYESASPGAPPFVAVGEKVATGQVLCIVEAMKLMNEIESDVAGEIVKKLVNNGQPVEYGQELFAIRAG